MGANPCSERGLTVRFCPGVSPNPGGRPTLMTMGLRRLEPMRHLDVLDGEMLALEQTELVGSATDTAVVIGLIVRRLEEMGQSVGVERPAR